MRRRETGARLLGVAVVLGLVAMLAGCLGARPPRTGVTDGAAASGVKKCRHFTVVRINHGHRVHVRVKKCVRVRSKACEVTWSKQKRHGKVVIRKHNPVLVAKVSCPKAGARTGPGDAGKFPLKVSSNGRFLETANNQPFLMVGDAPQALIGNLSISEAQRFFADRAARGFNTMWIMLGCDAYSACVGAGGSDTSRSWTYDGIPPFTSGTTIATYDFGTNAANVNPAYFTRVDAIIKLAAQYGMAVALDPAETGGGGTGGWLQALANNGDGTVSTTDKDYQYGVWLGTHFKNFANVIWLSGVDFQDWNTSTRNQNNVLTLANGVHSADPNALQTIELGFHVSSSLDDSAWSSLATLNYVYTYGATYNEMFHAYNQSSSIPAFFGEGNYEGEQNGGTDGCIVIRNCRMQEWYAMTSGSAGQWYGSHFGWRIQNGWTSEQIDTPGATQLGYQTALLSTIPWYNLVPEQAHGAGALLTAGYGTYYSGCCAFSGTDYATAAETPDGKTALIYMPTSRALTIDLSKMNQSGSVTARFYDPTNGTYHSIAGSPFAPGTGSHRFPAPGTNDAGDSDWVLVLQAP